MKKKCVNCKKRRDGLKRSLCGTCYSNPWVLSEQYYGVEELYRRRAYDEFVRKEEEMGAVYY